MRILIITVCAALAITWAPAAATANDLDVLSSAAATQDPPAAEPAPEGSGDPVAEPRISWSAASYSGFLSTSVVVDGTLEGPESVPRNMSPC